MDNGHIATLEDFDLCSRQAATLFQIFGVPAQLNATLISVAILGPLKKDWIDPWSERIVSLLSKDGPVQPVTIRPWITSNTGRANDPAHLLINIATAEGQATGLLRNSLVSCAHAKRGQVHPPEATNDGHAQMLFPIPHSMSEKT